jgi:chondroitin AC lyase
MLVDIGIMLKPYLSEEQNNKIKSIVERGVISSFNGTKKRTGANLMDAVDITIKYAFLTNRAYFLKKAVAYAEKEIFISEGDTEGIKTDYTFYQHGAQQACMSYGIVYVSNLAKFICWLNGTLFQFSAEKLGILVDFILEGQRYACRGNRSNYLTNGRSYSRRDGNIASSLKSTIGRLLSLEGMPRKSELQQFYYSFDDLSYAVNDTKYYPYAHSLFTISPDYYMAVKGAYQGFRNSELVNSENILARNMGYGGLTTYQYTGYEYDNIGAIWDFSMLPGTTAFNETDAMLVAYQGNSTGYYYGSMTTHSGGASVKSGNTTETITCSTAGGLYVDIVNEEGLYSRQAYICYQGLMIGLGNSLTCSNLSNSRQIFTTINQVYAVNATYHYTAINGTQSITDTSVVYNDAFAYYNLGGGDLKAVVRNTTGDLKRNNLATSGTYSADVFTLYYIQGICPQNQSFAYAVLANPHSTAPNDASGLPIMKITNTNIFQAVEFTDGTTVAIFHQAGTFTTMNGKIISAANACVEIDFF